MKTRIDRGRRVRRWKRTPMIGSDPNMAMRILALPLIDARLQGRIGRWCGGTLTMLRLI